MRNESEYNVFLSYARNDDEPFVSQLYNGLSANGYRVWWDRACMPNRALKFTQEIRDAVEKSDRLLLVVGPQAMASDYVRYEWQHALLFAKGVVPILRLGKREVLPAELCSDDYKLLPPEISKYHCPDFREPRPFEESFTELLRILEEPVPELGVFLTLVPALPPHFVPRPYEVDGLMQAVLSDIESPTVITSSKQTTALQGMGGIGKSVLAAAFVRSTNTRRAFTDGIIWLPIGYVPDLLQVFRQFAAALGEDISDYLELPVVISRLPKLLERKVCLIVLDDVWDVEHAKPFQDALGPRCRLLITTRRSDIIAALGANEHSVDLLSEDEAMLHLANWSGVLLEKLPDAAKAVVQRCGYLPLALSLCGAHVRAGTLWSDLLDALRAAELEFLNHPHGSVFLSLKVSVDALSEIDRQRYFEFAVFPGGVAVPEETVSTLWEHTGHLRGRHVRQLLSRFKNRALLNLDGDAPNRRVSLHDLQRDYILSNYPTATTKDMEALHRRLIEAYRQRCGGTWWAQADDGYFFSQISWHFLEAGRAEELRPLLFDVRWLEAWLRATDPPTLIDSVEAVPSDEDIQQLAQSLRMSAHVLAEDPGQLRTQVFGRLMNAQSPVLRRVRSQALETLSGRQWLWTRTPSLMQVGGSLQLTLEGHGGAVHAVAVTVDGRAISSSIDGTLKIWDLATGECQRTLEEHCNDINAVAVTADGRAISSAIKETLKVWDLDTGECRQTLEGHGDEVNAVAVTTDGRAVSASDDSTLKVWDLDTGECQRTLEGHKYGVNAVAVTTDGRAVSASNDSTLKVWDLDTGKCQRTLEGHEYGVNAVAVTTDGRAVSASNDGTLKGWDLNTGKCRWTLEGHDDEVNSVAVTADGRAVSASDDGTLKIWDLATGECQRTLEGHSDWVTAVAVTTDGRVVSASADWTLRVWDLAVGAGLWTPERHAASVNSIAVTTDGRAVSASDDGTLKIWDLATGECQRTLEGHGDDVNAVAVTTDGRVVSASSNGTLMVWDLDTGDCKRTLEIPKGWLDAVTVTADGRAVTARDMWLRAWNLDTGECQLILKGHRGRVTAVAVTTAGRAVSASKDGTLKVWDLDTGECRRTLEGHEYGVNAVGVSNDGSEAVSGSDDRTLKVWDLDTGKCRQTLKGHHAQVVAVGVTIDGLAVSASWDRTLKVWNLAKGELVATFNGEAKLLAVGTASEHTFVAGDEAGMIHILDLQEAGQV